MPKEPKALTFDDMEAAVALDGKIAEGATVYVRRSAGKPTIPIQEILQAFRAKYPQTTFKFGDRPTDTRHPTL
jgi:hypothetical protein